MNVKVASERMLQKLATTSVGNAKRDAKGKSSEHASWMLYGIAWGYVEEEKAHRWLGYAQGILVSNTIFSLEAVKKINHEA